MIQYLLEMAFALTWTGLWLYWRLSKTDISRGTKLCHIFFTLFLIYRHIDPVVWIGKTITALSMHGERWFRDVYKIDASVIPASIALPVWMGTVLLSASLMGLAIGIAARSGAARRALLLLFPLLYVVDSSMYYFQFMVAHRNPPKDVAGSYLFSQLFYLCVFGWVYVLMYLFYRSKRSDPLFDASCPEKPDDVRKEPHPE
jgi:hypothetical protein